MITFLFFLFPLTNGIPGYTMLVALILLIIKGRKYSLWQFLPLFIIFLLELYSELIGADMETISGILSFLSFSALFFYFLNDKVLKQKEIPIWILFFSIGTIFAFIVIFYNVCNSFEITEIFSGKVRGGALGVEDSRIELATNHLVMNANTIAYYAICSVACLQTLLKFYRHKPFVIALIIVILACGTLSFSRTLVLCLAIFFLLYTLLSSRGLNIKYILFVGLIFVSVTYFAESFTDSIYNVFIERSKEKSFASAGGRTILFDEYNGKWFANIEYIFFGCGVVSARETLHGSNAIHSGLQQIWVCLGIIGFLLFIQQLTAYILRYRRRNRWLYILPFLITMLFDQSVQFLNPYPLMLPIVVSLLVWKYGQFSILKP